MAPEINVIVRSWPNRRVLVSGQVTKPGRYDLNSSATIVDALAMAGGFKEFAGRSRIVVIRTENGAQRRIPFDYDKTFAANRPQQNLRLRPGDIVMVP